MKRVLVVSVVYNFALASYLNLRLCEKGVDGSQFCYSFIFMKKICILSYILCCCFDICNNVAGKWEILVWRLWVNSIASSITYNT
jgi:hypothetical protein